MPCYAGPGGRLAAVDVYTEKKEKSTANCRHKTRIERRATALLPENASTCRSPELLYARSSCSPTCSTSTLEDYGVTKEQPRSHWPVNMASGLTSSKTADLRGKFRIGKPFRGSRPQAASGALAPA